MALIFLAAMIVVAAAADCGGHSSASACDASPDCRWNANYTACLPACRTVSGRSACSATPGCRYSPMGGCINACAFAFAKSPPECANDPICAWSATANQCVGACPYEALATYDEAKRMCNADSGCVWRADDPVGLRCLPTCRMAETASRCPMMGAECTWDASAHLCRPGTTVAPPPSPSTATTTTNAPAPTTTLACSQLSSETQCLADAMCYWNTNTQSCVTDCSSMTTFDVCAAVPACVWSGGQCQLQCGQRVEHLSSCNEQAACRWSSGHCTPFCGGYTNETACQSNSDCTWDAATAQCLRGCRSFTMPSTCSDAGCTFNSDTQQCLPAAATTTPAPAPPTCKVFASQTTCNADAACVWNVVLDVCTPWCAIQTNRQSCAADPSCTWANGTCTMHCQLRAWAASPCENIVRGCTWSAQTGTCQPFCGRFATAQDCHSDSSCAWDNSTAVCSRGCASYLLPSQCNAQSGCRFDYGTLLCGSFQQ